MKKLLALSLLAILLCQATLTNAQPPCAFDPVHTKLLAKNPAYARQVAQNSASIRKYILEHPELNRPGQQQRTAAAYTIPVVVHVMHTGGAIGTIYNPSDAQIIGAIDYMNAVFAGTYPGMQAPVEGGGVVDMEVRFALAQRTPGCAATTGINRVDASGLANYTANGVNVFNVNGVDEVDLKNASRWNTSNYYNIWIVNKLDGADGTSGQFIAGFAYFPGAPAALDGTIMLATQMVAGEKTLPHEIGHALNLYHTFNGSNSTAECPPSASCNSTGDEVCDTDPVSNNVTAGIYNFNCRTGVNGCPPGGNYSVNTESNFMAYTNCYSLFTNGQKARTLAAMALPSRSSLVSASNLALSPCGTSINFNMAYDSRTEDLTGTLAGCRRYTDYTYQLTIGSGPSATATATLSYAGTAIKGLDYDVTTNGNFSSPSDVLTFTAGSSAPQSFRIRVYEDSRVEPDQTIQIGFTVNNGSGNASKGVNIPDFELTLLDNDVDPIGSSAGTYSVGTASINRSQAPFNATLQSQRGQYLYQPGELAAAGLTPGPITDFQLFVQSKLSTRPFTSFSIRMANSTLNYLIDGSINIVGGMTTVYTSASYSTVAGWNVFTLSTPFVWDGTSLAVEICYDNVTADGANFADAVSYYSDGGAAAQRNTVYQNGINCAGNFSTVSTFNGGSKPIIRLSNLITGTEIETATSGSASANHIAAGSNDYFYSSNDKLLMKLSNVDQTLDCVSASLENQGTTWVSYSGGFRSAKVFAVSPSSNGSTVNYNLHLYFDNAELDGRDPALLRIAKTSAASIALANSSNTIYYTPTVTTLGTGTTVFEATMTGFSRFFLVDAGITLPVSLVDFSGRITSERKTILNWQTVFEQDNLEFQVEWSKDGTIFQPIGAIPTQGNSSTRQDYQYQHNNPVAGPNWYRLKQVDKDGRYSYSKTIVLNTDSKPVKSSLYPVPARQSISVQFGQPLSQGMLEIFSTDLRVVHTEKVTGSPAKKEIDISRLPAGVYFIRISTGAGSELLRFVKE